jgi:ABC-type multidrug transport system ATPase subunit
MDVIAMRKTSGTVTGDIRVNGFLQERDTFRRFTGYVEQFDVQSPELTVRETVLFSARMRLGSTQDIVATEEGKVRYVDWVLRKLDLTVIQHFLVGNDEEGGLSFEQRKRLSVAVEMAASPSLIFLDEPTSGLDSKAALTVMKAMRELADTGRTVVATIHQPSLNIFEMFDELLLLKKGGRTVFFGELGQCCKGLVDYFESLGAPPIEVGENPANWMLKVITAEDAPCDYAEAFNESELHKRMMQRIDSFNENPNPRNKIEFSTKFATTLRKRQGLINERFRTIYFRSPAYNLSRLAISILIAFILGSVFLNNRHPDVFSETDISSLFATVFISFIIMGVLSIISVLPVMLKLRDSFYKFRLSGMVGSNSVALALGVAEKWFIVVSSAFFCLLFISTAGLNFLQFKRVVSFWGFFTFNLALYSYFGQAFMCLVRGMGTAMILASVFIGINNFFSGLIVRPQYIVGFFVVPYYITPGHYVYEGLMVSLFDGDNRTVVANQGSDFYDYLDCSQDGVDPCQGTVDQYFNVFFGGKYNRGNISLDIGVLTAFLILARLATFLALKYFNYTSS